MSNTSSQNSCKSTEKSVVRSNDDAQEDTCYDNAMAEPANNNLINFIATTVETMRDQMATKDDLVKMATSIETLRDQMATKEDLTRFATKEDLAALKDQMATKDVLARMATKDDLAHMATKDDLARMATTLRGDIEQVQLRLDSIDHALGPRMGLVETDISRLRSVLYLLVKDKPEMLRLLGQSLSEGRPQM